MVLMSNSVLLMFFMFRDCYLNWWMCVLWRYGSCGIEWCGCFVMCGIGGQCSLLLVCVFQVSLQLICLVLMWNVCLWFGRCWLVLVLFWCRCLDFSVGRWNIFCCLVCNVLLCISFINGICMVGVFWLRKQLGILLYYSSMQLFIVLCLVLSIMYLMWWCRIILVLMFQWVFMVNSGMCFFMFISRLFIVLQLDLWQVMWQCLLGRG